jgi:tetratricopeptide (TPR) repeat protein
LVSGRAEWAGALPASDTLDRAASVLARSLDSPLLDTPAAIRIDDVTAGLLDARFEVKESGAALFLCNERELPSGVRTLLGKPTRFAGREPELRMLEAALDACVEGSCPRVVLVTAGPGVGKSRLQHELVQRVRAQGEEVEVLFARGDSTHTEVPLSLLGQLVRHAARISGGEPLAVRREKLRARLGLHVDPSQRRSVAAFLGAIAHVHFADEDDLELRAARQDPALMADQLRRSLNNFILAECRAHPVLMVLDDLHWADFASVELFDFALRIARDLPLLVVAFARPEVHQRFPNLWSARGLSEIRLGGLSRKTCERFVREVLGTGVSDEKVISIASGCEGNAFLLEELVRAAIESPGAVPETVLVMMHSRIEAFPPEARRVLRAGSIFGETFWRGALDALLGGASTSVDDWLNMLVEREMLVRHSNASFRGEVQYTFRHGLVRDAAYEMLTHDDRMIGHQLAGAWLQQAGEPSAIVIAQHFDLGGDPSRAAALYCRAAEQALEVSDFVAVIARASRAEACGPSDEDREKLALTLAEAHFWRGDIAIASVLAQRAMKALPPSSDRWFAALQKAAEAAERLGRSDDILALAGLLVENHRPDASSQSEAIALSITASQCSSIGALDLASKLLSLVEPMESLIHHEPRVAGTVASARAMFAFMTGNVEMHQVERQAAIVAFEQTGHARRACHERCWLAVATMDVGAHAQARELLGAVLAEAQRLELRLVEAAAKYCLGTTLSRLGAIAEALEVARSAVADFVEQGDARRIASSRAALADVLLLAGDLDRAEQEARRAVETGRAPWSWYFMATLADVLVARGRAAEALEVARVAHAPLDSGEHVIGEAKIRLVFGEALAATGDIARARDVIAIARDRLLARAARISDPDLRRSFLERVPENERTLRNPKNA